MVNSTSQSTWGKMGKVHALWRPWRGLSAIAHGRRGKRSQDPQPTRREVTVTLDTLTVKRYTPPRQCPDRAHGEEDDGAGRDDRPCAPPLPRPLLPPTRSSRLWRPRRPRRADGARARRRQEMADEGRDARGHRGLPVLARTARHPG